MIDQDSHTQQAAATRQLHETIARLAGERQRLIEDLTAARQRTGEEAAAAAVARAEVERLRRIVIEHGEHFYADCPQPGDPHGCPICEVMQAPRSGTGERQ
jgi:hypothetical protein